MERFQSLPLGALRLTEKFGDKRFADLCEHVRATLHDALASYDADHCRLIATGGTITTLARVECGAVDHATISREKVQALVRKLEAMPLAERKKVPGLPPERADIIVAGGAVVLVAMEVLEAGELTVSVRNLRYGALVSDTK
jgi:exopolyphosphatase/guanosine-5'-triphosphate,3'-diphosphate pyrophosphatase